LIEELYIKEKNISKVEKMVYLEILLVIEYLVKWKLEVIKFKFIFIFEIVFIDELKVIILKRKKKIKNKNNIHKIYMEDKEIERMLREIKKSDRRIVNVDREIGLIYSNEDLHRKMKRNENLSIKDFVNEINEIYFEVIYRSDNKEELLKVFMENIIKKIEEMITIIKNRGKIGIEIEELMRDVRINDKYKCYNILIRMTKPIRQFLREMTKNKENNINRIYNKYIELLQIMNEMMKKEIKDREIEMKWRTYYNNRINNKQNIEESNMEKISYNIKKQYYKINNKEIYDEIIYEEIIKNKIKQEFINN
jgi:hypothetical protein